MELHAVEGAALFHPTVLNKIEPLENYRLWLRFDDGASRDGGFECRALGPMFEPLKNKTLFAQATIHPELETVTWPNGADLAPEFLYEQAARPRTPANQPEAASH